MGIQTSGGEIIGIQKKINDADPADSHHAPEWKVAPEEQNGLRGRLLLWRSSPQWMRDDLENIYTLLFMYVGNGTQLALCNVSWVATREFVVLVPDPVVFAPWSVLVTAVKTRHTLWCCVSLVPCPTTSPQGGDLDDGTPKRGALRGSQKTVVPHCVNVCFLMRDFPRSAVQLAVGANTDALVVSLLLVPWGVYCWFFRCKTGNLIAAAVRKRRRRLQRVPEAFERHRCSLCT